MIRLAVIYLSVFKTNFVVFPKYADIVQGCPPPEIVLKIKIILLDYRIISYETII